MKCETCKREIAPHNGPVCDWCLAWPDCLTCEGSGEIVEYPEGEPTIVDCPTC